MECEAVTGIMPAGRNLPSPLDIWEKIEIEKRKKCIYQMLAQNYNYKKIYIYIPQGDSFMALLAARLYNVEWKDDR
jgi:hypothetical protein